MKLLFLLSEMSSQLTPYNFTISDQSPLFQYLPGPIQSSWNVTYADNPDSEWAPNVFVGTGVSHSAVFERLS